MEESREARRRLEPAALDMGRDAPHHDTIQYAVQVSDKLLAGHDNLKGKVRKAMGGDHIETLDEIIERQDEIIERQAEEIKRKDEEIEIIGLQTQIVNAYIELVNAQNTLLAGKRDATLSHMAAFEHILADLNSMFQSGVFWRAAVGDEHHGDHPQ